jgi:hypothetical protein
MDRGRCVPIDVRINQLADEVAALTSANAVLIQDEGTPLGSFTTINLIGAIAEATNAGGGVANFTITGTAGSQNLFETIAVSGQGSIVADTTTDTLTVAAGSNITLTTNTTTDTLTIAVSGINCFSTIAVSGQSDVVADSVSDTLTLVAGSNITLTTSAGGDSVTIASSGGAGGSTIVYGELDTDLTVNDATVTVNKDGGGTETVNNEDDPFNSGKYLFIGNATGRCAFTNDGADYRFVWVQPPITMPV